jgi:DNA-binding CsgD family transcriptional regulator
VLWEWAGDTRSLSAGDCHRVLELVAEALRCASPGFPDASVTGFLRDVFQTDFAGVGQIDFLGTASRPWADSPHPIPGSPDGFHEYVTKHPLALTYRHTGEPVPLRLSDVTSARTAPPAYGGTRMSRLLTIALAVTPVQLCAIALLRSGRDFTTRDLQMACQLQPALSGIYALRDRLAQPSPGHTCQETGIMLTMRELAVLNLMADGLIAAAIARRPGISPRTVNKHIEHIYEKLGTHDRTTTAPRAGALGFIRR